MRSRRTSDRSRRSNYEPVLNVRLVYFGLTNEKGVYLFLEVYERSVVGAGLLHDVPVGMQRKSKVHIPWITCSWSLWA